MATCPVCNGSRGHWAVDEKGNRRWVNCFRCSGSGQV